MSLRLPSALVLALCAALPLRAEVSGPYLAARQAILASDYTQAVQYYSRAVIEDPSNLALLESAILANIGTGDIDTAARIGGTYSKAGGTNQIVQLLLNMAAMKEGDFEGASADVTDTEGLSPLLNGLIQGWALLGGGQMSEARSAFAKVAETDDFAPLARYHEALALSLVGDFEGADRILSGEEHGPLTLSARGIDAHAQVLVQLERESDALELLDAANQTGFFPDLLELSEKIAAGEAQSYDFVTSPQDGAAEVLFTIAAILQGRAPEEQVLTYTRLASYVRPDFTQAKLMSAELLEDLGQYDLAEETFGKVEKDDPSFFLAELGRANALYASERKEEAVAVLGALSENEPEIAMVHAAYGDFLGRMDRDEEAIAAYTKSIALRDEDDVAAWPVYYARGIVYERNDQFPEMEADFRKALELRPNQPQVLNYLGYSLVEQRIKLDEALGMIETAVAERPDSGYITDSLGWVFYRLGRYDEAVEPMERAVSLLPVDPIVNDHLGDVYWKVGRFREAEFQWKRALSFDPEEAEVERIKRKLEVGLDVVLEEEATSLSE